jgi:hypothetical protein
MDKFLHINPRGELQNCRLIYFGLGDFCKALQNIGKDCDEISKRWDGREGVRQAEKQIEKIVDE